MTAPTVVYIESTTAGGTTDLPSSTISSPAAGDLAVIIQNGTQASSSIGSPQVTYTSGGGDASYTTIGTTNSGSGDGKVYMYAKILVAGDFSGPNLKQLRVSNALPYWTAHRYQLYIFRHANGWEAVATQTPYTDIAGFTANTNQTLAASSTRPNVAVFAWANSTAQNTLTMKWDSSTAREPYCGNATGDTGYPQTVTSGGHTSTTHFHTSIGTAQSDYNEYDSGTGPATFQINAGASASHAVVIGFFQTAVVSQSGTASLSGGGTFTSSGVPTVLGTASLSGGGTFHSSGTPTVFGTASLAGGGTFHSSQQGANLISGTASMLGGGTFSAGGARLVLGTAALAGGGTFHSSGTPTVNGSASLSGGGTFHASGIVGSFPTGTGGSWSAGGAEGNGGQSWTGVAAMAGGGTFHSSGTRLAPGSGLASMLGGGTLAAVGVLTRLGTATMLGGGTFTADGVGLGDRFVRGQFRPRQRGIVRG